MKKIYALVSLLLLICIETYSQRLIFCADYTKIGQPITPSLVWNISASGGAVNFLFQNETSAVMPKNVYFYINKLSEKEYLPFDVKSLNPDREKSFAVLDYKFLTAGSYEVVVKDESAKVLTKEYVTIKIKESTAPTSRTSIQSTNYNNSVIISGVAIDDNGTVSGTSPYYNIPPEGAYVIFKVNNIDKPLNTSGLIVDIYKKSDTGTYEFVETKKFDITSTFYWVYFKYTFYNAGDFKLAIYDKEWKYINTVYTTIKVK